VVYDPEDGEILAAFSDRDEAYLFCVKVENDTDLPDYAEEQLQIEDMIVHDKMLDGYRAFKERYLRP
jgi:hypothetical protein